MTTNKPGPLPIVGRERERATLLDENLPAVIVRGEPGIGKSRLLASAREASSRRSIAVRCHRSSASLAEPLLTVVAALRASSEPLETGKAGGDPPTRLPAIRDALARHAAAEPILIQLDDVHWLPLDALDDIVLCIDRLQDSAIRWHLALRPEAACVEAISSLSAMGLARVVDLEPLRLDESQTFVERLGIAPSPGDVGRLHRRSGGNPFYLEQLASAPPGDFAISGDLQAMLRSRIAAVPPAAREVAEAISLCRAAATLAPLASALRRAPDVVAQQLVELAALGIVRTSADGYEFGHDVLRDVCSAMIAPEKRASLHDALSRTAASTYERALHLQGAGRFAEAAYAFLELADAALGSRTLHEARAHFASAAAVAPQTPEFVWRLAIAETVFVCADGDHARGARMLRALLPAPDGLDGETIVRSLESIALVAQNPLAESARVAVEAALAQPGVSPERTLRSRFTRVTALYNEMLFAKARDEIATALAIPGGDENVLFDLRCIDAMIDAQDDSARGIAALERIAADPAARMLRNFSTVYRCLAHATQDSNEMTRSFRYAKAALEAVSDPSLPISGMFTLLAEGALSCGRPLEAIDAAHAAYARNARVGVTNFLYTFVIETESVIWLGRFEEAGSILQSAAPLDKTPNGRSQVSFAFGMIDELRGEIERAIAGYEQTVALGDAMPEGRCSTALTALARLHALRGDRARARDAWSRLRAHPAPDARRVREMREADLYLALVEGENAAVLRARYAELAAIDREQLWRAVAQVHVSERARDRAGFLEAIETFDRAEARDLSSWARKRANALGFRFAATLAEREVLTARELAAARLVAQGKTNKEISTVLGVSPKTVAHHVAAILDKTGLRSRVEVAAHVAAGKPFRALSV